MMEQNYWYEEQKRQHFSGDDNKGKRARSISAMTLVICMLVTALVGGATGGLIAANAHERELLELQQQVASLNTAQAAAIHDPAREASSDAAVSSTPGLINAAQPAAGAILSKAQVVEYCSPSIVGIDVEIPGYGWYGQQSTQMGSGSGIILTSDGYIITNNHVVEGATNIKVYLSDDTEYMAELVARDSKTDLAVIKVNATNLHPVTLGDSNALLVGDDVLAIGNPLGELRGSATSGMVSALQRTVNIEGQDMTLLQTDAAINPGNSGGGLFNMRGELVGVVNAKIASSSTEGLGFAIPVNDAKEVVSDLIDQGYVSGRAYLGITMDHDYIQSAEGNRPGYGFESFFGFGGSQQNYETRVVVTEVVSGAAADRAGIKAGDYILAVDDEQITDRNQLALVIREYSAGDQAIIKISRDGQEQLITVTFDEKITPEQ